MTHWRQFHHKFLPPNSGGFQSLSWSGKFLKGFFSAGKYRLPESFTTNDSVNAIKFDKRLVDWGVRLDTELTFNSIHVLWSVLFVLNSNQRNPPFPHPSICSGTICKGHPGVRVYWSLWRSSYCWEVKIKANLLTGIKICRRSRKVAVFSQVFFLYFFFSGILAIRLLW